MRRRLSNESGTAVVEFLVILPFLLLLLFVVVELSRAWLTVSLLQAATREGARQAAILILPADPDPPDANLTKGTELARQVLQQGGYPDPDVTLSCHDLSTFAVQPCDPPGPNQGVRIQANVVFRTLAPLMIPALEAIPLSNVAVFRRDVILTDSTETP